MVGHTRLLRHAGVSYTGRTAAAEFPARADRNRFFASVGALPAPDEPTRRRLGGMAREQAYTYMADSARNRVWG